MEKKDFISKYVQLLSGITDAPSEFQETAALFLLSTAVGRKWIFRSVPETAIFSDKSETTGKLLNLWFIIMGKSRITRKSKGVIDHVEELSKKVFGEQRLVAEAFTPESLIKEMSEKRVPTGMQSYETICYWIADEIAWFFQQLRKRDSYMATADSLLCKIYDGTTYSRATIGRGKETVWNPYLVCLLASTDSLPTLFSKLHLQFGFLNRFVYVIAKKKTRKPLRTEPLTQAEKREVREIEDFLRALVERTSTTLLEMSSEAKALYESFEEGIENRIETEELGITEGYCGQLPNLAVRLSCLYRISRMTPGEVRSHSSPVLTVEKQDVERAISYAQKAWIWFEKVIEIMHKPHIRESTRGILTRKGREIVVYKLKEGPKRREDFLPETRKAGISDSLLDNTILPSLIGDKIIERFKPGWYRLVIDHTDSTYSKGGDVNEG